jgi:hypothetical protein
MVVSAIIFAVIGKILGYSVKQSLIGGFAISFIMCIVNYLTGNQKLP